MPLTVAVKITMGVAAVLILAGLGVGIYFAVSSDAYEPAPEVLDPPPPEEVVDPDYVWRAGAGIADMTGPCVEITFMGYAELTQRGEGIHTRQYSRAFIFDKDDQRVVLVTADVQAVGIGVRREVVRRLQELYGDVYTLRNVILTGTHTHSGPGGHLQDFLLDVTILGFSRETFDAYVDGITRSIVRAHENMVPARLFYGEATVKNAHMNRSPYSYNYNPEEERARYEKNTDDTLTQVRIVRQDGGLHGVLNWFSVHTTSVNMTNHLISSDNFGYAALRLEKILNPGTLPGKGNVVAGFFSSNLGDVSPNILGARCEFSGEICDHHFLLCDAGERCFALGPGENGDMYDSARVIGTAVLDGALEALSSPGEELTAGLSVQHQFVHMPTATAPRYDTVSQTFDTENEVQGCVPAMGHSFAAGTQDGANTLNITHGQIVGNPLLDLISHNIIANPTPADVECHAPKPILLMTGRANFPVPWHPATVTASVVWLGGLAVLGVPGEPTTMAGRRMRAAVAAALEARGAPPKVVVSGLTNEYIHYVVTYEEYQVQRYEAASTIYGPHTLDIFIDKFVQFIHAAIDGVSVPPGTEPEDIGDSTLSLILPVVTDNSGIGRSFGQVLQQPPVTARRGDTIAVSFVAANPRNNLRQEDSHVVVESLVLGGWTVIATDADWETRFHWERESTVLGTSRVDFTWTIPQDALMGSYRIVYRGTSRSLLGSMSNFTGTTNIFIIDTS